jgi:hypothetical protein
MEQAMTVSKRTMMIMMLMDETMNWIGKEVRWA